MWPGCGDHMGWMALWWVAGLAILVLLIWAVARIGATPSGPRPSGENESPEAVLKQRYARGEIDDEEFERRLGNLRK